ncbi:MAG: putative glycolipid-binding domain-containing protein [Caldilineaceae bacterium]
MNRHFFWQALDGIGLEHLILQQSNNGLFADSWVIGQVDSEPFRLHYTLRCDAQWRTRSVTAAVLTPELRHIEITVDEEGVWTDSFNNSIEELDGCVDLDISATPFTNTLPIRRLGLKEGEAAVIEVAYLSIPDLEWRLSMQRYTCLTQSATGARYQFESIRSGFRAEIEVNKDGIVTFYPQLFKLYSI